jgi:hypothetical protein
MRTFMIAVLLVTAAAMPAQTDPLSRLVELAFSIGFGGPLGGKICTALGITSNNQPLPVEQISVGTQGNSRSFNVSRHRGRLDIILSHKTKDETTVFLTSSSGDLEKALREKNGQALAEIPVALAADDFAAEKSWWTGNWLKNYEAARKN